MEPIEILPQTIVLRNTGKYDQKVMVRDAGFILPAGEEVKVLAEESWEVIAYLSQEREGLGVNTVEPGSSTTENVTLVKSIDMGLGAVSLTNSKLKITKKSAGNYEVSGTMDLQDVATTQKLTYDPNTVRNFFVAAISLDLPAGVTFNVNTMSSSVTGTMPRGMEDVPKTLKNTDKIEGNTYTWLFNGKTSVITIKYTASDSVERTITITNRATLTTETQEFTKEVEGVVQGMEGSEYVTTVNVACETGWPFTGEYTITPGENCTRGIMDNIFGNGGMAQVKLYGTTDRVTMKATLEYTGTSDYQQTQPSND